MASKAFRQELERKTGHDLPWFSNAMAGCRGGISDVIARLRDFESPENAAESARETADVLLEIAGLLDPVRPSDRAVDKMTEYEVRSLLKEVLKDCRAAVKAWKRPSASTRHRPKSGSRA